MSTNKTETVGIESLTPDSKNANIGSVRGAALIEHSLRQYGAGRSLLLDKNLNVISGNQTLDGAASIGIEDIVLVHTRGEQLVGVVRDDLDIDDPKTRELAIADNRASELSLTWDGAQILELANEGADLSYMFTEAEQAILFEEAPPLNLDIGDKPLAEATPRGDAVLRYDLIFEDHEQQERFHAFLRELNARFPEAETIAARLDMFISATLYEGK